MKEQIILNWGQKNDNKTIILKQKTLKHLIKRFYQIYVNCEMTAKETKVEVKRFLNLYENIIKGDQK